jgi:hypothetical protein
MIEDGVIKIKSVGGVLHGITLDDMRTMLAVNYDTHGEIVTLAPINKWAKYKPIRRSELQFTRQLNSDFTWKTVPEIVALGESPWWKGTDGQCGLTFETAGSLYTGSNPFASGSFLRKLKDGDLPWGYVRPTGTIGTSPFRYRDFNYYHHAAPKPVLGVFNNLQLYDGGKLTVQLDDTRAQDSLGLQLSDLVISQSAVSGWYIGILIYKSDSQFTFAFSTNTVGGSGDLSVEFTNMTSFAGPVTIVPFLSSVRANQGVNPGAGIFLSCDVAPETVTIGSEVPGLALYINAEFGQGYAYVKCSVRFVNNQSTQAQIRGLHIKLNDGVQDIKDENIGNVNIAANGIQDYSYGRTWNITYDSSKTYKVIVSATSPYEANGEEYVNAPRNPDLL